MSTKNNIENLVAETWTPNLTVTVKKIWEDVHESMSQSGIFEDRNGDECKFVAWKKSNLPLLEEDMVYNIKGARTSEYEGNIQMSLVSTTEINTPQTELPITISPDPATVTTADDERQVAEIAAAKAVLGLD